MSLANATVASSDVWSYHHNPGALANIENISLGLSYENRFLLKELQTQGAVVAIPMKVGVISVGLQSFGYKTYRSNRAGVGYSLKLTDRLSAGVQMNYQGTRIENYGSKHNVTAEAGVIAKINDKIDFGFSIFNIGRTSVTRNPNDWYGTFMRIGLSYKLNSRVLMLIEAQKEVQTDLRVKGAVEYQLVDDFYLRLGAASNPMELTFGVGYNTKSRLKIDLGSAFRQYLGWSPHFGLTYDFNK